MSGNGVSASAQAALLKLLLKLRLIDELSLREYTGDDYCPIAFFANKGIFEEEKVIKAVAKDLHVNWISESKIIEQDIVTILDQPPLNKVSLARWQEFRAIPIKIGAQRICVAWANPLDHENKTALEFSLGRPIDIYLAAEAKILSVLALKLNHADHLKLDNIIAETVAEEATIETVPEVALSAGVHDLEAAPVVRLVNKIYNDSFQLNASDIHLNPEKDYLLVRTRVDGIMRELFRVPNNLKNAVISRIKLMCGMDIAERRKPQDGRAQIKTGFGIRDLRISAVPAAHGENLVIRVLSSELENVSLESLGISEKVETKIKRTLSASRLFLVSGPTGSGKTSTLYSVLSHLKDGVSNIITVEDPIEYRLSGITQIQINPKIGMGFAEGLRSILRQDPDVVMVGEIRDVETANISMQMAQTGHLVLSTIHTNSAAATVTRLRDLGIENFLIASSLGAILAQRLVRRLCPSCMGQLNASDHSQHARLAQLESYGLNVRNLREARGCQECNQSGYKGRIGVFSFLEISSKIADAIRRDSSETELEQIAKENGFVSLEESAIQLLHAGITSYEEVERNIGPLNVKYTELEENAQNSKKSSKGSGFAKRKVLLVEDDENTRTVLSMLLQRDLLEVVEAHSGEDSLKKLFAEGADLIVLDLMMPGMDGAQVLERIRKDSRTRSIPVLVLTAADTEEIELRLITIGANDFVSKTADSRLILARIHNLLEGLDK